MISESHFQATAMESVLVDRNQKLIWSVIHKYKWSSLDRDDLFAEGVCGMLRAARKFDASKGMKFTTYAVTWIRQCIGRAVEQSGAIRIPSHYQDTLRALWRAKDELGEGATTESLQELLGWDSKKIALALEVERNTRLFELDAPISTHSYKGDGKETLGIEMLASSEHDPAQIVVSQQSNDALWALVDLLPARSAQILRARLEGKTLSDVGQKFGISRERTRQIELDALKTLRRLKGVRAHV